VRHLNQTLSDILDTCGDNIDAAIKRLGELQLTAQCTGAAQKLEHPSVAALRGAEPGQANSSSGGCWPCAAAQLWE
jgi:hypothetical protein